MELFIIISDFFVPFLIIWLAFTGNVVRFRLFLPKSYTNIKNTKASDA